MSYTWGAMVVLPEVACELLRDACPGCLSIGGCEVDRPTGLTPAGVLRKGSSHSAGYLMHVGLRRRRGKAVIRQGRGKVRGKELDVPAARSVTLIREGILRGRFACCFELKGDGSGRNKEMQASSRCLWNVLRSGR